MGLPLQGIRVVEFSHMVMGPTCGLVLADLGADVIKVEPPRTGDKTRRLPGSGAGFFPTYNRNKRSLAVDPATPEGRELIRDLVDRADVLTENFRPGRLDALGLGYDDLKQTNPGLIYCSLKGFLNGPYEDRAALDEVVQMMGGLAYMTGPPGRPLRAGASVNDIMGGMFAAIGILAALQERGRTGHGQLVRSSLFENNAFLVAQHMAQYAVTGTPASPMPARLSAWAVYDVFETADDEQIFVGVVSDTQWRAFCTAFGLHELGSDPSLASNEQRVKARDAVLPELRTLFRGLTRQRAIAECERIRIPCAPVLRPEDLFDDPQLRSPGAMIDVTLADGRTTPLPALPLEMAGNRLGQHLDVPRVGEHTAQIVRQLGYADDHVERLAAEGTISLDRGRDEAESRTPRA
ncbi:CaiB/BaiF CoA-transferase family protein [Streptomyces sp. P17]|uniref:CaiB/BaiF CoA transferase family protein n=1 Tax=Streptomyces sp. P17 TaxID=3074716 RepID=UPI0028F3F4C4|nr:CaiB/BaiF CoA-transferase family protein [Streptomyces sp. P17]MDT9697948.1 CaiB/BaiF CoA-transferase family protein [Streptomyces sp. P17]